LCGCVQHIVLFGPLVLRDTPTDKDNAIDYGGTGVVSGLTTLIGGFSGKTEAKKQGAIREPHPR